jgi:hypothetical protein
MQLGETIATYDVALALRGESGKFEVTSPTGEIYNVTCKPNHSISNLEWSGNKTEAQPFLIRKVAEPVSIEPGKAMPSASLEGVGQTRSVRTPFLLENQGPDSSPSSGGAINPLPCGPQADSQSVEAGDLELFYSESDPKTRQPSAFVYLNNHRSEAAAKPERPMTAVCTSFNELDAEIRKLHAELDQIRSRARKKFYKAQAAAASA